MKSIIIEREAIDTGNLVLVNKAHPLKVIPQLQELRGISGNNGVIYVNDRVATMFRYLIASIQGEGQIIPVSGFRSVQLQQQIYQDALKEKGTEFTRQFVALPNCSEHHTGLAMDLGENTEIIDSLCPHFPYAGICQKFRDKAGKFGFIQRYQAGKETVTGIACEPWHFRYVGYPHSDIMEQEGLVLEEYLQFLAQYPQEGRHYHFSTEGREMEIFFKSMEGESKTVVKIPEQMPYMLSGNNIDGLIVTIWR